jgi:uncharacterized protein (DUF1697 family)
MMRYAAFLRGMNLGGRRITNVELCAILGDIGMTNPAAFLASGNLVFDAPRGKPDAVAKRLERGFREALGYEVPTFLRTDDEVRAIAARDVFVRERPTSGAKLQVMLLGKTPAPSVRKRVLSAATEADLLELDGRELYWLPRRGILDTELNLKSIEGELGLITVRTRRTVERLAAKYLES